LTQIQKIVNMRPGTARIAESVAPDTTADAYEPPARPDRGGAL